MLDKGEARRTSRRAFSANWLLMPSLTYLIVLLFLPLAAVVKEWLAGGHVSSDLARVLGQGLYRGVLANTGFLAALVAGACLLLAYPLVYFLVHSGPLPRRFLLMLVVASMLMSPLVRTYAWTILLQRSSPISQFLVRVGLIQASAGLLHSRLAVLIGMTHVLLPIMTVSIWSATSGGVAELREIARAFGARNSYYFVRIFIPATLPGATLGLLAVFLLASGFYITPELLGGGRGETMMFATLIEEQINTLGDWSMASALCTIFTAFILLCVAGFVGLPATRALALGRRDQF